MQGGVAARDPGSSVGVATHTSNKKSHTKSERQTNTTSVVSPPTHQLMHAGSFSNSANYRENKIKEKQVKEKQVKEKQVKEKQVKEKQVKGKKSREKKKLKG